MTSKNGKQIRSLSQRRRAGWRRSTAVAVLTLTLLTTVCGCGASSGTSASSGQVAGSQASQQSGASGSGRSDNTSVNNNTKIQEEVRIKLMKNYKTAGNTNPIMTQAYGADPYAMVYGDTVYFYMTADAYEYDASGAIIENSYNKITTIHVVSTKDMKNFTDCGEIPVAGRNGIAKWAGNSWAPAAAWKNIDGKDRFFLYFANSGGGIGVLTADSPTGPFTDPIGHELVSRRTPECADVLWLFDPAVLVDDDGTGYLYFGGGVPEGMTAHPGTARCVKLGDDMISLDGVPARIDAPFLFEDSGIHKFGGKYYYSYCTNWNVSPEGRSEYGLDNGEIAVMESDSPLGPFTFKEQVLQNPGRFCGLYGNNHHCIFTFGGEWYITYHTRMLEKAAGVEHGYRATSVDRFTMKDDGSIGSIMMTKEGPDQLVTLDPSKPVSAVTVTSMAGCSAVARDSSASYGEGSLVVGGITAGTCTEISGVDLSCVTTGSLFTVNACAPAGTTARIRIRLDNSFGSDSCIIDIAGTGSYSEYSCPCECLGGGVHSVYLVFEGEGFTVDSWQIK